MENFITRAESPIVANTTCTRQPRKTPNDEYSPPFIPHDIVLEMTNNISFPGVRFKTSEASIKR